MLAFVFIDRAKQQRLDETGVTSFDDAGYSTFEMRQSRRGTMKSQSRGTLRSTATMASRKSTVTNTTNNFAMINGARNPPRPTPSMVNYSDEDSAKGYDENPDDSDSLTEKPSEISSTDSQVQYERADLCFCVYFIQLNINYIFESENDLTYELIHLFRGRRVSKIIEAIQTRIHL